MDNLRELSLTYTKMGRYQDALGTYRQYVAKKDSADSLKNIKAVLLKEAQAAYTAKENATQAQLDAKKREAWFYAAGIIILLILSAFVWRNLNRQRKLNAELKAAQQQLIQSEKMASLGELTAGIAHEIQNPLNFVNNFSDVNREMLAELQEALAAGDIEEAKMIAADLEQNEEKINHHGKRADGIVKGMLEHSRTSTGQKELTDLNKLADEYLKLAYHGFRAKDKTFNAELVTRFNEHLSLVNVIPQDIGRVLLNLFNNAFYAVQQKQKTAGEDYKPTVIVTTFAPLTGSWAAKVKDNGSGIPEAIRDKVMQPFFTTKPTGEGTGLGLSLSYDIVVKAHGGQITVNSTGDGAEFVIVLPQTS